MLVAGSIARRCEVRTPAVHTTGSVAMTADCLDMPETLATKAAKWAGTRTFEEEHLEAYWDAAFVQ